MEHIIATFSALDLSLSTIARKHPSAIIVIHRQLLDRLKESFGWLEDDLEQTLFQLRQLNLIEIAEVNIENEEFQINNLDQRLGEVLQARLNKNQDGNQDDEIKWKEEAKQQIILVTQLSKALKITPYALVSSLEKPYFAVAGIRCITTDEYEKDSFPVEPQYRQARKIGRWHFFISGCLPVLLFFGLPIIVIIGISLLGWLFLPIATYLEDIFLSNQNALRIGFWIWVAGIVLYWTRSRFRLFYGVAECLFGVVLSYLTVPGGDQSQSLAKWLAFFGALYIIVRGLDNVGRSLKEGIALKIWERIFGKKFK